MTQQETAIKWYPLGTWLARTVGVVTIFEKGVIWGGIQDALAFGNKHQRMLGEVKGFLIGEVIHGNPRIEIQLYQPDKRELKRMARRRRSKHLKRRGIRVWQWEKYLKKPLERYFRG